MSETTPLLDDEEEVSLSPKVKYTLIGAAVFICAIILYVFTVLLPTMFVPQPVALTDINKITHLNAVLTPVSPSNANEKQVDRIIMIGDIHGHYKELKQLLKKLDYNHKKDHVLVLGDFISKGPDSLKVIEYLSQHNIDCIIGNHEYYVLENYAKFHGLEFPGVEQVSDAGFNSDPEFLLAKKLQPEHVKYINKCSLIKTLGNVPNYGKKLDVLAGVSTSKTSPGIAVHGGLRWDLSLEDQPPMEVLEMRSLIGPFFNQTTDDPHEPLAVSWSKIWNKKQDNHGSVVYYGHDARRGLNIKRFAKGIDTGCDRGELLLAIVLWDELVEGLVVHKERVVQVGC